VKPKSFSIFAFTASSILINGGLGCLKLLPGNSLAEAKPK